MNFIQKLWNNIITSNDAPYITEIKELKEQNNYLLLKSNDIQSTLDNVRDENEVLQANYDKLCNEYKELKDSIENPEDTNEYTAPDFLDTTKFPYLPNWLIYYYDDGIKTKNVNFTPSKFYKIWSDEMYHYFRDGIKGLTKFDSIVTKLRDLVYDKRQYELDVTKTAKAGENWRPGFETFYGGIGDCEDSTILWITACNICGINPERVFNATGHLKMGSNSYGHSYGVAKFDDGHWYVIETTSKRKPIKLIGSDYTITKDSMLNGLTNWKFSGKSKLEQF